jgi:hypothetical protein
MRISEFEFDEKSIGKVKEEMKAMGSAYVINETDDNSDDYLEFLFIGKHNGTEMLFDAALYTLQLHHESELYDEAEKQAMKRFPEYRDLVNKGVEIREGMLPAKLEEEIGIFITETMLDLEEEESVKVKEHMELDEELEARVGIDVCLNVDKVTPAVVEKFISDFNAGQLRLDPTLYSFESDESDD